jgi:hypothetical protein
MVPSSAYHGPAVNRRVQVMARPTQFNAEQGWMIIQAIDEGRGRVEAARAAGIGLRTLAEWLAKGKAGDPAFAEWVSEFKAAERFANRLRCNASWARERARSRERYQRFKAARVQWWLDQLGPCEFWSRRLDWLADRGMTEAYDATVARLRAEGFRIIATL